MIIDRLAGKMRGKEAGEVSEFSAEEKRGRGRPSKQPEIPTGIPSPRSEGLVKALNAIFMTLIGLFGLVIVLLLLPIDFKKLNYFIPYFLPILFFASLLIYGLKGLVLKRFSFRKSALHLAVLVFALFFLFYIPFLGRNLFSYVFLKPLIYLLAILSFFLFKEAFGILKNKKILMALGLVIVVLAFLVSNPTLRNFYKNTLKMNVSEIPTLSVRHSWDVAIETIKNQPVFGVGPGNYQEAFTLYKPMGFNQTDNWSLQFAAAGNLFFQLMTVGGLLAVIFLGFFFVKSLKSVSFSKSPVWGVLNLVGLIIIIFLIPFSFPLLFLFFALLALFDPEAEKEEIILASKWGVSAITLMSILVFGIGTFFMVKLAMADANYQKAQEAKAANLGSDAYRYLQEAIKLNPQSNLYHRDYALVNVLLANSLAGKGDLTDVDKDRVQKLLQQAVREAKLITEQINPVSSANWETRAQIYRNLIGAVENAEQWSVLAYLQAINLDPLNPKIKVDLGGIYYQERQYQDAQIFFQDAARVKSDYANAHYNLAYNYKQQENLAGAVYELNRTLSLIEENNSEYEKAKTDLDAWQKELDAQQPAGEELQPSESTESAQPNP